MAKQELRLYQVETPRHKIILHASDEEDAIYCANEGWDDIQDPKVSPVENPETFRDLQIGVMRDIKK